MAQTGSDEAVAAALRVTDVFLATFNAQDWPAHFDTYNFPHVRIAGTEVKVWGSRDELLKGHAAYGRGRLEAGWARSTWDVRDVIHSGPEKVHLAVQFTRHGAGDTVLATYRAVYVITCVNGHWGVQARSTYAP